MTSPLRDTRRSRRIDNTVNSLLDKSYNDATARLLESIANDYDSPKLRRLFDDLDRVLEQNKDQPSIIMRDRAAGVMRAIASELDTLAKQTAGMAKRSAAVVEMEAIKIADRDLALNAFGKKPSELPNIGVDWNTPDPRAVRELITMVDSAAFADKLEGFTRDMGSKLIRGIFDGQAPLVTARQLRTDLPDIAAYKINQIVRTTQLVSYRRANAATQAENSHLFAYQIRVSARDQRTCLSCWGLHGKEYPVGVVIEDHESGRCRGIAIVKRREIHIPTGPELFERLPIEEKIKIAGFARYEAMRRGDAEILDFVHYRRDPVFGKMISTKSLVQVFGSRRARKYYYRNQPAD